jgi:hypothetical protein
MTEILSTIIFICDNQGIVCRPWIKIFAYSLHFHVPKQPTQFLHMSIIFKNNTDAAMLVTHNHSHVPPCLYTAMSLTPACIHCQTHEWLLHATVGQHGPYCFPTSLYPDSQLLNKCGWYFKYKAASEEVLLLKIMLLSVKLSLLCAIMSFIIAMVQSKLNSKGSIIIIIKWKLHFYSLYGSHNLPTFNLTYKKYYTLYASQLLHMIFFGKKVCKLCE